MEIKEGKSSRGKSSESVHSALSNKRMIRELLPYRGLIYAGMFCMVLASPFGLFHPMVWMFVVDHVIFKKQIHLLLPALGVMVISQGISIGLGVWRDRFLAKAGNRFVFDLRNRIYHKINMLSMSTLHNTRSGDLISRIISDVESMHQSLIFGLSSIINEVINLIIVLIAILWINWKVSSLTIIPLLMVYLLVRIYNPRVRAIYWQASQLLGKISARLHDNLQGFQVIKVYKQEKFEEAEFEKVTRAHYERIMQGVQLRTFIYPISFLIGFSTNVILLGLGAYFVWKGEFTVGGLIAFRGYWWQLNSPIRALAELNDLLQRAKASSRRVYEVLDLEEEKGDEPDAVEIRDFRIPLVFKDVFFNYPNGKQVFKSLSFKINTGEIVAIAGESGAGKTTLFNLLYKFYEPLAGEILFDKRRISEIKKESLRRQMAIVLQDTFLFNHNVLENIRYGRPESTLAEVTAAAERANAHEFIANLPQGYQTIIGERGVKLSGGQRQRISIARAFLSNPALLLLDEPTSSVEPESEWIIQQSLVELMRGRTTLISSHRPSLLRRADRILFLQDGRIVETGTHDELIQIDGSYAKMVQRWESAAEPYLINVKSD